MQPVAVQDQYLNAAAGATAGMFASLFVSCPPSTQREPSNMHLDMAPLNFECFTHSLGNGSTVAAFCIVNVRASG